MKPSDAYKCVVDNKVERLEISEEILGRTVAIMLAPYPPGIPIIMGGEILNNKANSILAYLIARQDFENEIPGYDSDIHGVERVVKGGKYIYTTLCVKE